MSKFFCLSCECNETIVIDSRFSSNRYIHVRRRRKCEKCKNRFSTVEVVYEEYRKTIKENRRMKKAFELLKEITTFEIESDKSVIVVKEKRSDSYKRGYNSGYIAAKRSLF